MSYTNNTHPYITTQTYTSRVKEERVEQVSQCLETIHTSVNATNTPSGPQKLERPIITQVRGLCQPIHGWLVAPMSTLMITLLYQEISVPT